MLVELKEEEKTIYWRKYSIYLIFLSEKNHLLNVCKPREYPGLLGSEVNRNLDSIKREKKT
jgi:hypothetical protein